MRRRWTICWPNRRRRSSAALDSDIFTVSAEGSPALPEDCAAAFACPPPVWREAPRPKLVGCTLLALYRRETVQALMQSAGLGFDKQVWDNIPPGAAARSRRGRFRALKYDTAELLNVLLVLRGRRVAHIDSHHLRHVGNYSAVTYRASHTGRAPWVAAQAQAVRRWLGRLRRGEAQPVLGAINRARGKKERVDLYLNRMLDAMHGGDLVPSTPWYFPQPIRDQVKAITMDILTLHAEFQESPFHTALAEPTKYPMKRVVL